MRFDIARSGTHDITEILVDAKTGKSFRCRLNRHVTKLKRRPLTRNRS